MKHMHPLRLSWLLLLVVGALLLVVGRLHDRQTTVVGDATSVASCEVRPDLAAWIPPLEEFRLRNYPPKLGRLLSDSLDDHVRMGSAWITLAGMVLLFLNLLGASRGIALIVHLD
jgi:hypothetical protein